MNQSYVRMLRLIPQDHPIAKLQSRTAYAALLRPLEEHRKGLLTSPVGILALMNESKAEIVMPEMGSRNFQPTWVPDALQDPTFLSSWQGSQELCFRCAAEVEEAC